MILSQKKIEEIAVAVIRDFQKSFFGSEADDPARFALPTPIDQFASDYLNLKVSFQKLSSDGSIYGLTAYVDTEYQIDVGCQLLFFYDLIHFSFSVPSVRIIYLNDHQAYNGGRFRRSAICTVPWYRHLRRTDSPSL
jgi:hypothetical protein